MKKLIGILFIFIISSLQMSLAETTTLPTPIGRVVWVKGLFQATMPNHEIRTLQKDSIIYLHDMLTTGENSQAQIVYTDNTLMTFRAQTKFYIENYAFNPQSKTSVGKYIMNLLEGGFRTITGAIAKHNPDDYRIITPVATIGVRGTDYAVYVHNGQLLIGYYQGTPCVTSGAKKGGNTLCLSAQVPYITVPVAGAVPVPVLEQPEVFKDKLEIIQVTLAPFTSGGYGKYANPNGPVQGTFSSFCIQ